MEPFHVRLNRLTYEEGPQEDSSDTPLDSFSNVVNYDTYFTRAGHCFPIANVTTSYTFSKEKGVPIISPPTNLSERKPNQRKTFAQPSQVRTTQIYSQSLSSTDFIHQSALINPHSNFVDSDGFLTRSKKGKTLKSDIRTVFQIASNTQLLKPRTKPVKKPQYKMSASDSGVAESQGVDGPQSFETVADALHLQWSVIGDKKITPASADVVAQVVAEAQRKLKAQSQNNAKVPETDQHRERLPSDSAISLDNHHTDGTNVQQPSSGQEPEGFPQRPGKSPQLIPISAESIVRSKDKSSWLGGMGDNPLFPQKENQRPGTGNWKGSSSNDTNAHSEDREDSLSVSSSQSELEGAGQSETDKFLRSLPPITQIDLSAITPKTKYKNTVPSPVIDTFHKTMDGKGTGDLLNGDEIIVDNSKPSSGPSVPFPMPGLNNFTTSTPIKPYQTAPLEPLFYKPKVTTTPKAKTVLSYHQTESNSDSLQLEQVLKEKAKLEGKLEMLVEEAETSLREKTELQASIATLKQKLKNNQDSINDQEKELLHIDMEKLKKAKHLLEMSLSSAHKFLEEKTSELKFSQEELNITQETNLKLQINIKNVRDELRSREVTIQALKNKIAELYVEVQSVMQSKMESDNDARTAKNDLVSMINTKNWYQQQLQAAQEARSKLQTELTILQGQANSQSTVIENLKTENTRIRQQVKDVQQKAIKEKEVLARHLETIQSDILQRESAMQEVQKERTMYEQTFNTKLKSIEDEKSQMKSLMKLTSDLEKQLDMTHENLKGKQNQILTLENEQIDLMKKLTLSQETVSEKDALISEMQQKLIEVESGLEAFRKSVEEKQMEIWKLKEEKAAVEISLKAAKEEKLTVDKVLDGLKGDMTKVELKFKSMKHDLTTKSGEYESLRKEKNSLQDEVDQVKQQLEKVKLEQIEQSQINRESQVSSDAVDELRKEKIKFEEEVKFLKEELSTLTSQNNETVQSKNDLESELNVVKEKLLETEAKLSTATKELEDAISGSPPLVSAVTDGTAVDTEKDNLLKENEDLKTVVKKNEKQFQREITKQKAKAARLNQDLGSLQKELTDRQAAFDSNVEVLSCKIRELTAENEQMETELEMAKKKLELSSMQHQDQQNMELQKLAKQLEATQLEKQALENQLFELQRIKDLEVKDYQQHLSALEEEIEHQRELLASAEEEERLKQQLTLELEKEKGKVAGLQQTNQSLKQHVGDLEEAISRRESAFTELEAQTRDAIGQQEREGQEKAMKIQQLEDELQQEKSGQRDVRKQIGQKISENKKLRRQYDTMQTEKENMRQDLEHVTKQVEVLQAEMEAATQTQNAQTSQLQALESENKDLGHQLDSVQRELADVVAREAITREQIENLKWQLEQKMAEIESLKHQAQLSQERHETELSTLNKTIQEQLSEIDTMRQHLMEARQEKAQQQAEMAQLRSTLKASIQHHKLTQKLNQDETDNGEASSYDQGIQTEVIIPPLPFDLEAVEDLLQKSTIRALQSKPLDDLQSCLSSLRSEISGLQKQMQDHVTSVEVTTQSWNHVETQVNDLRTMVLTLTSTGSTPSPTDSLSGAGVDNSTASASCASSVFDV